MNLFYSRLLFFLILFISRSLYSVQSESKPNFIFILTDDQTFASLGFSGNDIVKTPNLDKLATEGIFFSNAHITSAICTPSRVSIFLSQYERKHGVNFNSGTSVSPEAWQDSYPVILRKNGYYTGYIGKNHSPIGIGGYVSQLMEKSFDYWYAGHGHIRFYPKERHDIFKFAKASTQVEIIEEGINDFMTSNEYELQGALHFLDKRPDNQPFCLSVCFNLPHDAGTGTMESRNTDSNIYKTLFRDVKIPLPKNYISKEQLSEPKIPAEIHHFKDRQDGYNYVDNPETVKERIIRRYQSITGIDQMVGRLRDSLEALELDNNTVLIFTSDHGIFHGEFGLGGKGLCYELCTHVPFIVYIPFLDKSFNGKISNALVQSIDIAPTMLTLAGIEMPESYQGKSLMKLIRHEETEVRSHVYTENLWSTQFGNPRCEAVQDHHWKYIRYYENSNVSSRDLMNTAKEMDIPLAKILYGVHDQGITVYRNYIEGPLSGEGAKFEELYDIKNDPNVSINLAAKRKYRKKLEEMRDIWQSEIKNARGTGSPKVVRYTLESLDE